MNSLDSLVVASLPLLVAACMLQACIPHYTDFTGSQDSKKDVLGDVGLPDNRAADNRADVWKPDGLTDVQDVLDRVAPTDVRDMDVREIDGDRKDGQDAQDVPDVQLPWCGDGECNALETCATCQKDCGPCCPNGECDEYETACSCPDDCDPVCVDGCCTGNETCESCPGDCGCVEGEVCWQQDCCQPDCLGKECGDDGCGGSCGTCELPLSCGDGSCIGCGDGVCGGDETCFSCKADCDPCCGQGGCQTEFGEDKCSCPSDCGAPCTGKECGDDGCGGECGDCALLYGEQYVCEAGTCACIVDCKGKECGSDGCGGTCGSCQVPMVCADGVCIGCGDGQCGAGEHKCNCPTDCTGGCPGCCAGTACKTENTLSYCGVGGEPCDECTGGEACEAGDCVCTAEHHQSCSAGKLYWYDSCNVQGIEVDDCDDGTPCTTDGCSGSQCTHSNKGDDTPCGNDKSCQSGVCEYHCGDGLCAAAGEETCGNCVADCACIEGTVCLEELCAPTLTPQVPGQILITEMMMKSQGGADLGEWVELYNTTDEVLDLDGCSLKDLGSDLHVIDGPLPIAPGEYLLLAKSDVPDDNHGLPAPAYKYSGFTLSNWEDEVMLECGDAVLIDQVAYTNAWVMEGVATQLSIAQFDAAANDELASWCPAVAQYGTMGKLGTPGSKNTTCPCGNGILEFGESCDDGNQQGGDGCDENCQLEQYCGDGMKGPNEECDDGNQQSGDGCDENCQLEQEMCGDGMKGPNEECDDGCLKGIPYVCEFGVDDGDGCNFMCKIE